jgi:hypothetical protein
MPPSPSPPTPSPADVNDYIMTQYQAICQQIISLGLAPSTPDLVKRHNNTSYAKKYYERVKRNNPTFLAAVNEREKARYNQDVDYRERKKAYMRSYIRSRRNAQKAQQALNNDEYSAPLSPTEPPSPYKSPEVGEPLDLLECMGAVVVTST